MTLQRDDATLEIQPLGPLDVPEVLTFLARDPLLHVYVTALALRDALARPHDEYWGARRGERLVGMLYVGGLSGAVLPVGDDHAAFVRLGEVLARRMPTLPRRWQIIGPRTAVRTLADVARAPEPRLAREQLYMALSPADLPPVPRVPELRAARREDYALVYESGAALRAEELLEDPRATDPIAYARRVEEDCRDGHTFVWRDAGGLAFRASVSALTSDAAQVSGVYTPPSRRGRGLATRGLAELCRRLFERSREVCLFVNDFNDPAQAVYRRLGFRLLAPWGSMFFERHD